MRGGFDAYLAFLTHERGAGFLDVDAFRPGHGFALRAHDGAVLRIWRQTTTKKFM